MRSAIRNFLVVTWVTLMCAFIAWAYVRHKAMSEPVKTLLEHPFLTAHTSHIVAFRPFKQEHKTSYYTFERLDKIAALSKDLIIWIDVHPLSNGTLVAGNNDMDSVGAPTLAEVLDRYKSNRLILNFRSNQPGMKDAAIVAIGSREGADKRILIQSPEDGFLKELRELMPLWLYGTSQAQVTRMIMLSSIGLQAAAPIKGDVFVMESSEAEGTWRLNDAIISEVHRRQLKVFAGPFTGEEAVQARNRGIDGLLTTEPELVLDQAKR